MLQKAGDAKNKTVEAEGLESIQLAVMASHDDKGINTTSLAKNLSEINGLTDTDNQSITEITLPKSVKLNNIKYKIKEDGTVIMNNSILPDEFEQVEYIESSGTQYINTKYYANGISSYSFKYSNNSINGVMFGAYNGHWTSGNGLYINITSTDHGNPFLHYYSNSRIPVSYYNEGIIEINRGTFCLNGVQYLNLKPTEFNVQYSTYIFCGNWNGQRKEQFSKYRLYYFRIYEENEQIRFFVPCYSTTTVTDVDEKQCSVGTVGLYDTVNGQFYTNQGTGTFGYGMEDGTYVAPTNN